MCMVLRKAMGEDLALLTGADVWILRVASLFGIAGASGKGGNFVETMIRVGKRKGRIACCFRSNDVSDRDKGRRRRHY